MSSFDISQLGRALGHAGLTLIINPLLYIGLALLVLELYRDRKAERKFFGIRLTRIKPPIVIHVLLGVVVGLLVSAVLTALGAFVTSLEVWAVTGLSLVLALIRVRFLHIPYAVGVLLLVHCISPFLPHYQQVTWAPFWTLLDGFHAASWLAVTAGVSVATAILVWLRRRKEGAPSQVLGKRGGAMGAYIAQLAFFSAFVLPVHSADVSIGSLPGWWPLIQPPGSGVAWHILPVFTGLSALFTTRRVQTGLMPVYRHFALFGLALAACTYLALYYSTVAAAVGGTICLAGSEWFVRWLTRREFDGDPLFAETPLGVRVLATVRGSLAEQMGLLPGEIITHVNQVPVHTTYDLHFAFEQNPAYARLQVMDTRGEVRFVGKPVYEGERHRLGLVFAPATAAPLRYNWFKAGLFQSLYAKTAQQRTAVVDASEPMQASSE